MSLENQIDGAMRRLLEFTGRELVVVNREVVDRDERYRDPVYDTTETRVNGEVIQRGMPQFSNLESGLDSNVDSVIWVPDTVDVATGNVGDDSGATIIRDESTEKEYIVYDILDEGNGKYRLMGVTKD